MHILPTVADIKTPPKVSVIVPVFGVEAFIEQCARSLFNQTLSEIEYIFVNDCSTDQSLPILRRVIEEFPDRMNQIKIVDHEVNKGVSASRNSGLAEASGDYVIHCDSDDWIAPLMYEALYAKALKGGYDIVWCDYFIERKASTVMKFQDCASVNTSCIKAMLCNLNLSTYLWNKLVKRDLYEKNGILFPDGINIREDFLVLVQLFYLSASVGRIPQAYYHYRHRDDSISRNEGEFDKKDYLIQHRLLATGMISDFLVRQEDYLLYEKELMCAKLILKRLILSNTKEQARWMGLYPETNQFIFELNLPPLFQLMLWAASRKKIWLIKLSVALINSKNSLSQRLRQLIWNR